LNRLATGVIKKYYKPVIFFDLNENYSIDKVNLSIINKKVPNKYDNLIANHNRPKAISN